MKCQGCPLAGREEECAGEFAPALCRGKDEKYREILLANKKPQPPGRLGQVVNFVKAATTHVSHFLPLASDEEVARRRAICEACEYNVDGTCQACKCPLKRKTAWLLTYCPLDPPKWDGRISSPTSSTTDHIEPGR